MISQVKEAINVQLDSVSMVYGGLGLVEVRARLAELLSELCPGDMNGFLFTCGGGEANEAAMRMAKRVTGKQKIINQYRSYHGGSSASLTATGDFRRWFGETGTSGFVKTFNPQVSAKMLQQQRCRLRVQACNVSPSNGPGPGGACAVWSSF